ncbi:MAG: Gfo/Idh/MocA family protein [Lachnospiraceae bacterium]|jgi:predicted dehydrogenase
MAGQGKLTVGVVGSGAISGIYLKNMIHRFGGLKVKCVASAHLSHAQKRAQEYGIAACTVDELMADPEIDLVVNLTPENAHYEIIRRALEAGKHVYTEKVICADPERAKELLDLAREKGLYLCSAPDTFLGSAIQTAKHAVDSGLIGTVTGVSAAANRDNDVLMSKFHFLRVPGGGTAFDYGPYYLTAMVSILGPVDSVAGFVRGPYPERKNVIPTSPEYGQTFSAPVESEVAASLMFRSGVPGTFLLDSDSAMRDRAYFQIYGTKGILRMTDPNQFGGQISLIPNPLPDFPDWTVKDDPVVLEPVNALSDNCRGIGPSEMADAILEGRKSRTDASMAVHVVEVLAGILKSSETRTYQRMTTDFEIPAAFAEPGKG